MRQLAGRRLRQTASLFHVTGIQCGQRRIRRDLRDHEPVFGSLSIGAGLGQHLLRFRETPLISEIERTFSLQISAPCIVERPDRGVNSGGVRKLSFGSAKQPQRIVLKSDAPEGDEIGETTARQFIAQRSLQALQQRAARPGRRRGGWFCLLPQQDPHGALQRWRGGWQGIARRDCAPAFPGQQQSRGSPRIFAFKARAFPLAEGAELYGQARWAPGLIARIGATLINRAAPAR